MLHSKITGVGMYVPEQVVTNDDLSKMMDTSDEWIIERTGIKERRFFKEGVDTVSSMGAHAAEQALEIGKVHVLLRLGASEIIQMGFQCGGHLGGFAGNGFLILQGKQDLQSELSGLSSAHSVPTVGAIRWAPRGSLSGFPSRTRPRR